MREITWRDASGVEHRSAWPSEVEPPSRRPGLVGDATRADGALRRARTGEFLVYQGDYHNARQLLASMGRRLARARPRPGGDLAERWRAVRAGRNEDHTVLSRLLVPVEGDLRIPLRRAPDLRPALAHALGGAPGRELLLPLREVLGAVGSFEWRRRGVEVPALGGRVYPLHGVFAPVRGEHVALVAAELGNFPLAGKLAFDVGTGTGVLAVLLARSGARVVATDVSEAAVRSAEEEVARFGLGGNVEVKTMDLFPPGRADLVVTNPPWIPGDPESPLDRAVYDPGGSFLRRFLSELPRHLREAGEGWLVLSDLAELVGLRPPGQLAEALAEAGLRVVRTRSARPGHPRSRDPEDPVSEARSRETVTLYRLQPASARSSGVVASSRRS